MPSKKSALSRAKKIKLILFDVDGVLTDGKIWIFPAPAGAQQSTQEHAAQHGAKGGFAFVSQNMVEAKGFNAHDGTGFSLARLGGIKRADHQADLGNRRAARARSETRTRVPRYSGQVDVLRGNSRKGKSETGAGRLRGRRRHRSARDANCGLAIAVANARKEVKAEAHMVTEHAGGDGAGRDAIEFILKAQGTWKRVVSEYICERSPKKGVGEDTKI